jgi:hypothetical protein
MVLEKRHGRHGGQQRVGLGARRTVIAVAPMACIFGTRVPIVALSCGLVITCLVAPGKQAHAGGGLSEDARCHIGSGGAVENRHVPRLLNRRRIEVVSLRILVRARSNSDQQRTRCNQYSIHLCQPFNAARCHPDSDHRTGECRPGFPGVQVRIYRIVIRHVQCYAKSWPFARVPSQASHARGAAIQPHRVPRARIPRGPAQPRPRSTSRGDDAARIRAVTRGALVQSHAGAAGTQ